LVALSIMERAARCRLMGSDRIITLRANLLWEVVPGAIVTVTPRKQWRYGGHPYLSGEIQGHTPAPAHNNFCLDPFYALHQFVRNVGAFYAHDAFLGTAIA